jgi:hypothetical protein
VQASRAPIARWIATSAFILVALTSCAGETPVVTPVASAEPSTAVEASQPPTFAPEPSAPALREPEPVVIDDWGQGFGGVHVVLSNPNESQGIVDGVVVLSATDAAGGDLGTLALHIDKLPPGERDFHFHSGARPGVIANLEVSSVTGWEDWTTVAAEPEITVTDAALVLQDGELWLTGRLRVDGDIPVPARVSVAGHIDGELITFDGVECATGGGGTLLGPGIVPGAAPEPVRADVTGIVGTPVLDGVVARAQDRVPIGCFDR